MRFIMPYWNTRHFTHDLFNEMDKLFDEIRDQQLTSNIAISSAGIYPACEISEQDEHYLMSLDLPGVKKEDIKIEVQEDVLTISGERKREISANGGKNEKVQKIEKSYGAFKRSFTLPSGINADKVEARYENGVLDLYLPKQPAVKPRQIEIQTDKRGFFSQLLSDKKRNADNQVLNA